MIGNQSLLELYFKDCKLTKWKLERWILYCGMATKKGPFCEVMLQAVTQKGQAKVLNFWESFIPSKISFCTQEAQQGKNLTTEFEKIKRLYHGEQKPHLLNGGRNHHLLIHCPKTQSMWSLVYNLYRMSWVMKRLVKGALASWKLINKDKSMWKACESAFLCVVWSMWRQRSQLLLKR